MSNYLTEAFRSLEVLDEEVFDTTIDGFKELRDFEDENEEETVTVVDPDAEDEEELEDSYIGKVILDCCVCHTDIYKDKDEIVIDEEEGIANVGEECPYCFSNEGFKIIGEVKPFSETEVETEDEVEVGVDGEEVEEEEEEKEEKKEESFSRKNRKLKESVSKIVGKKSLTEAPYYELSPRYDSRKSFYGKAHVDTGDNDDKNKLWSYDTLVAEMKDGKPVVYGTYSATTLRHIKDWLKQNGFRADNAIQIMADYGVKEEACHGRKSKKSIKESCSINQCQKWVDYDMKKYKKISDDTMEKIKSSGYSVVKDQYGDYEVIADRKDSSIEEDVRKEWKPNTSFKHIKKVLEDAISRGYYINNDTEEVLAAVDLCDKRQKYTPEQRKFILDAWAKMAKINRKSSMKESIEDIKIDTGDQEISVSARDKEPEETGDEMIAPLSDEEKTDIEMTASEDEDTVDVDVDEFDEESFDELGESYLKKVYENVNGFKTTKVSQRGNKLYTEGVISFASGKNKKTNFVFEADSMSKKGKVRFLGENRQISRGKKSFTLTGRLNEKNSFISESLTYNYRAKSSKNESSQRVYGTVRLNENKKRK